MNDFEQKHPGEDEQPQQPAAEKEIIEVEQPVCDEPAAAMEQEDTQTGEEYTEEAQRLDGELEQIRDMFQQALNGEELLPPDGEYGEELPDEEPERVYLPEELCTCCSEKPKDFERGEDYPYCTDCTRLMAKTPLGFRGIFVILLAFALGIASLYFASTRYNAAADIYAVEAQAFAKEGRLNSALDSYVAYFSQYKGKADLVGKKAAVRAAKLYASCGYFSDAHDLITSLFSEEEPAGRGYAELKEIEDKYNELNATYDAVYAVISGPLSTGDITKVDSDLLLAELDKLKTADPKQDDPALTIDKYSEFFIEYYKYMVLANTGATLEKQYEQLVKVSEMEDAQLWAYGATLCSVASRLGKTDDAKAIYERLTAFNKEDATALACYANAYRFCETPDADKMLELLAQAQITQNNAPEIYRLQAVAYLMKGDYETANENAQNSLNGGYTLEGIYTAAVCSAMVKDDETYEQLEQILAYYGYEMSDSIKQLKAGKLKIDKILYDAQGVLA